MHSLISVTVGCATSSSSSAADGFGRQGSSRGLSRAVEAAGLPGPDGMPRRVVAHQLRHTWATELVNAGMSLQALMALLGHRTPEMTIRYARLSSPTLRAAYDQALGKVAPRIPVAPAGQPAIPDRVAWLSTEMLKTRVAHGFCARELAADACPYANVWRHAQLCNHPRVRPGTRSTAPRHQRAARRCPAAWVDIRSPTP